MTQFIELTKCYSKHGSDENFSINVTNQPFDVYNDINRHSGVIVYGDGTEVICKESYTDIIFKIKQAQANDPLERIAVALETLAKRDILIKNKE